MSRTKDYIMILEELGYDLNDKVPDYIKEKAVKILNQRRGIPPRPQKKETSNAKVYF